MIASVIKSTNISFKPINIEIRIESEEELADLWCRLNLADSIIRRESFNFNSCERPKILAKMAKYNSDDTIFGVLDDYIKDNLPDFFESKY